MVHCISNKIARQFLALCSFRFIKQRKITIKATYAEYSTIVKDYISHKVEKNRHKDHYKFISHKVEKNRHKDHYKLRSSVSNWSLRAACEVNMADCPAAAMGNQPWSRNAASKIKDLIFKLRNSKLTTPPRESLWGVYWCIILLFTKNKTYDTSSLHVFFACIFDIFFSYTICSFLIFLAQQRCLVGSYVSF